MKRILVCLVIVLSAAMPARARTTKLTLYPSKAAESTGKYRLLPRADKLKDADALALYEQAVEAIPKDFGKMQMQMRGWMDLPAVQLPQKQADEIVQKCVESLRLVARAARCKQCNWPEVTPEAPTNMMTGQRDLARIIALWARLETSKGAYEGTLLALQTGFGMARHLEDGPTTIHSLIGAAIAGLMCKEIEQLVQTPNSPNLYRALADLPRPFIDIGKAFEKEKKLAEEKNLPVKEEHAEEKELVRERLLAMEKQFDTRLNVLQAVEAIRHYAANNQGRPPDKLSDITDLEVPLDTRNGKAFEYQRKPVGAVLQSAAPQGADAQRDLLRYEIAVKI
jgi:hypothetical protein